MRLATLSVVLCRQVGALGYPPKSPHFIPSMHILPLLLFRSLSCSFALLSHCSSLRFLQGECVVVVDESQQVIDRAGASLAH